MLSLIAGLVSLVVRYRRAGHIERQQLKCCVGAAFLVLTVAASIGSSPAFIDLAVLRHPSTTSTSSSTARSSSRRSSGAVTAIYIAVVVGMGLAVERTMGSRVGLAVGAPRYPLSCSSPSASAWNGRAAAWQSKRPGRC